MLGIGRNKNKNKGTSRRHPSVRFRTKFKANPQQTGAKNRVHRKKLILSPLTPVGLAVVISSAALLVFLAWVFVFGQYFLINSIQVAESSTLSKTDISRAFYKLQDKRILFFVPGNHFLFLSKEALLSEIKKEHPYIVDLPEFTKNFPNKVTFAVDEATPSFVVMPASGRRYFLDSEGMVLGEAVGSLPDNVVNLKIDLRDALKAGSTLSKVETLSFAKGMQQHWPANLAFTPQAYEISAQGSFGAEYKIMTSEGWFIKADNDDTPTNLLNNLKIILANEVDEEERRNLSYIDLRLSNRAFYCLKDTPCSQ